MMEEAPWPDDRMTCCTWCMRYGSPRTLQVASHPGFTLSLAPGARAGAVKPGVGRTPG